jgi:hypothetical protein
MMKQTRRSGVGAWLFRGGLALGGLAALNGLGATAAEAQEEAPSKASCAQAYESAQESRAAGQLQETQKRLSVCSRPECPSFVQKDCARWLEEVERELPNVIVTAVGLDPAKAREVSVKLDGNVVPDAIGGAPVSLDPGRHELSAESPGRPPVTRVIMAQQGVQNRVVELDFSEPAPAAASAVAPVDAGAGGGTNLRPYAYVAWGVGAVGFGMFAVLGTLGRADEKALKDDCPSVTNEPNLVMNPGVCLESDAAQRKDDYEQKFLLADVGLVTGIVGAAAGTVLFLVSGDGSSEPSDSGDAAKLQLDVSPTPGGAFATVAGAF